MMINKCHSCDVRVGCEEKKYPCYIYMKEPKKVVVVK